MRIILVDPSRTVLKFVARLLEARDHEVFPFVDGLEALAHLRADEAVTALITSAQPTGISGVELCWEARLVADGRRPIFILMMSSSQDWRNVIEALDCGADDVIGKPPVAEELYARLRVADRLAAMQVELIELATTDPLTGLLNRRAFFERAAVAGQRARAGSRLSILMMDIDHFKRINDGFGHDVGDIVLRAVARAAAAESELVGRLGGEEFAILLEGRNAVEAAIIADRLRAAPEMPELDNHAGPVSVTCSIGVSEWQADDTVDLLLKRADVALYEAKAGGRNRVVVARTELRRHDAA